MHADTRLFVHQEAMLLALREDRGTAWGSWASQAIGGGILTDLFLAGRITLEGKRHLVTVAEHKPLGDPVLDTCFEQIAGASRRATAQRWVSRFAVKKNFHATAEQLCARGVLRLENQSVLLIFSRRVYPEIDPAPEREIVERLREAIFTDSTDLEPRTLALVSLASACELLKAHFDKKELKARKARIKQLEESEAVGEATAEVIRAIKTAVMVATVTAAVAGAAG